MHSASLVVSLAVLFSASACNNGFSCWTQSESALSDFTFELTISLSVWHSAERRIMCHTHFSPTNYFVCYHTDVLRLEEGERLGYLRASSQEAFFYGNKAKSVQIRSSVAYISGSRLLYTCPVLYTRHSLLTSYTADLNLSKSPPEPRID